MIPEWFLSRYPHVAAALLAMKSMGPNTPSSAGAEAAVACELADANKAGESFSEVLTNLFGAPPTPNNEFVSFGLSAYNHLGVSEHVCLFMGRLWADAVETWSAPDRTQFLLLLVRDRQEVFQALDFAVELFRRVQFTADEAYPWIVAAQQLVGNDLYQASFFGCIEAFCAKSPAQAIAVAERWLDSRPEHPALGVVSNMVGWLRGTTASADSFADAFAALEQRIQTTGHSEWRAVYIQSWVHGAEFLNENDALAIRKRYPCSDCEEEIAWCFLLNAITQTNRESWLWTHRELGIVAKPTLSATGKHWVVLAALHGVVTADQNDTISARAWLDTLVRLLPLAPNGIATWEHIHRALLALAEKDPASMREHVKIFARYSGREWLQVVQEGKFAWFFQALRQKGLHTAISDDLCFAAESSARRLGLVVFAECHVEKLDALAVGNATATQLELLVLEAQRKTIEYGALARLHACLVKRIDEIGGPVAELFYEEVALQCQNTHAYRSAFSAAIPNHEYSAAIIDDVNERLRKTVFASESPALQMEVPGHSRAKKLHDEKLAREVAKGVKEHSVFLNIMPTVHLLYSGMEYRIFSGDTLQSAPSKMHASSSSVEIPRMEILDPEGMQTRRMMASARIAGLEALIDKGDG